MWVLSHIKTGRRFYLLTDTKKYTVGRAELADLSITDDSAVSREHALIHRSSSGVRVEDLDSKYGVYVNEGIDTNKSIAKRTLVDLHVGNIVRFGRLESTFRLENIEVKVSTSTMSPEGIENLKKQLKVIDGVLINGWNTECTHLVMQNVTVTVKVLQSLAYGIPIVSPAFWDAYIECAREHKIELPNVEQFVPDITEPFILKESNMMNVHLDRQRLFKNKTFVFMVKHHMDKFAPIIKLAAGKCLSMDTDKVRKSFLCKSECIPVHYTASENSQSSSDVEEIVKYVQSNGRRLISDSEVGLAILHRSIDRFCNPDRKILTDSDLNPPNAVNTNEIMQNVYMNATPHPQVNTDPPSSNALNVIPESGDLSGTEPNNNLHDLSASPRRKSSRLSSKNDSSDVNQLMPPPMPPQPKQSTSAQAQKRKHVKQTSPVKGAATEQMSLPTKKQKKDDNVSGENSSSSAPIVDPLPSASQASDLNFSGFISTQNRRNRPRTDAKSQASEQNLTPRRLLEVAKESRKRAIDLLDYDSNDEKNDEDDGKMFNFNRKSKRSKVQAKGSQAKRRGRDILDDSDDDDDDNDGGFSFNFSRKQGSVRQSQAKRKRTENELNDDVCEVDASTSNAQPSQNSYQKPFQHLMNRTLNRTIEPIEFVPAPKCNTDWITRKMKNELNLNEAAQSSNSVKIKVEKLEESEMTEEEQKQKWIKSMANVFNIRKIDVNLSRSRCAADVTDNVSTHPEDGKHNKSKNFKKFVKKNNYIPRTTVIKTTPVPVLISAYARI